MSAAVKPPCLGYFAQPNPPPPPPPRRRDGAAVLPFEATLRLRQRGALGGTAALRGAGHQRECTPSGLAAHGPSHVAWDTVACGIRSLGVRCTSRSGSARRFVLCLLPRRPRVRACMRACVHACVTEARLFVCACVRACVRAHAWGRCRRSLSEPQKSAPPPVQSTWRRGWPRVRPPQCQPTASLAVTQRSAAHTGRRARNAPGGHGEPAVSTHASIRLTRSNLRSH